MREREIHITIDNTMPSDVAEEAKESTSVLSNDELKMEDIEIGDELYMRKKDGVWEKGQKVTVQLKYKLYVEVRNKKNTTCGMVELKNLTRANVNKTDKNIECVREAIKNCSNNVGEGCVICAHLETCNMVTKYLEYMQLYPMSGRSRGALVEHSIDWKRDSTGKWLKR